MIRYLLACVGTLLGLVVLLAVLALPDYLAYRRRVSGWQ